MINEDYRNMTEIQFISDERGEMFYSFSLRPAEMNNSGMAAISITITRGDEIRKYHPNDFLNHVIDSYNEKIDQQLDLHKQYEMCLSAKLHISNQVEYFKGMLDGAIEPIEKYNFQPEINKVNNTTEIFKSHIEHEKLKQEIRNLKRERYKFWWGVITGATTAIGFCATIYFKFLR